MSFEPQAKGKGFFSKDGVFSKINSKIDNRKTKMKLLSVVSFSFAHEYDPKCMDHDLKIECQRNIFNV